MDGNYTFDTFEDTLEKIKKYILEKVSELDKEREESKNINDFIRDLEGLIIFIETFFERLEQEKMGIEEPLGILKHLLSMLNRKKEKWEKEVSELEKKDIVIRDESETLTGKGSKLKEKTFKNSPKGRSGLPNRSGSYVLLDKRGKKIYEGITNNLKRRINEHHYDKSKDFSYIKIKRG